MFGGTFKDRVTNIVALLLVLVGAANAYFQSLGEGNIDWMQFAGAILAAVIAYFTGKDASGKPKV